LCYPTPLILYLINSLYTAYLSFRRKGIKEEKTIQETLKTRAKFTAKEKLNDGMRTASYKLELLSTINLSSPRTKVRNLVNRNPRNSQIPHPATKAKR